MSATGFQNRRRMIALEKQQRALEGAADAANANTDDAGVVDHRKALSEMTVKEALAYAAAHQLTVDPLGKKKAEVIAEILAGLGVSEKASAVRDATEEESDKILEAEGVSVGDVIELNDGEKYRIVSMIGKVTIEPVESEE